MKTQVILLITALWLSTGSCKKNTEELKDIKALFSDATWTGYIKYASRFSAEPFSIRFNTGGTFTWQELDGEYSGNFTVNNDTQTFEILFSGGSKVTGAVTADNKITNVQYGGAYAWAITGMEYNNSAIPAFAGTRWNGDKEGVPILLQFQTSTFVDFVEPGGGFTGAIYTLKQHSIRFAYSPGWKFFGVIKDGRISGAEYDYRYPALFPAVYRIWLAEKQ